MLSHDPDFLAVDQPPESLLRLPEADRGHLGDALQELLTHGSILGLEAGQSALYHWCRQNFEWLRETTALLGLDVALLHEERMVQALPRQASLQLRLRQDATLVWLALWYAGDVRWRDEGQTQALLTVSELNALLKDQLLPDIASLPTRTRLKEILRQAARYNLIRFTASEPFEESGIEVLPAIRRVVPFQDFAEWTRSAAVFRREESAVAAGPAADEEAAGTEEEA
ncbi:MAG: DUF4194 domain-containing protein [Verrucomicrobium sp.]|nr:DUF4194 domain-containing protein [Verrucomicrobium sp.]